MQQEKKQYRDIKFQHSGFTKKVVPRAQNPSNNKNLEIIFRIIMHSSAAKEECKERNIVKLQAESMKAFTQCE